LTKEEQKKMKAKPMSSDTEHDGWGQGNGYWNDWDYNLPEMNLRQWDGDWLPAPVEWEGRRGYKVENFAETVAKWIDRTNAYNLHMHNCEKPKVVLCDDDIKSELFLKFEKNAEFVPRCWIPEKVEGTALQEFWQGLLQSNLEPIDEDDLQCGPFWQRYLGNENDFQMSLEVPNAHLNAGDEDPEMYAKGKNETAADNIERKAREATMSQKKKEALKRAQKKALQKEARKPKIAPPPNPHRPSVNIYLRPASPMDLDQILLTYNHYAERTCYSAAMTPMTRAELTDKMLDIERAHLQMIVAIQKVSQPAGNRTTIQSTQEKLVGFAFADEHEGRDALFRYAADLEMYVHPDYVGKGVGKSLLDRMMFLLDPAYSSREAVEWRAPSDAIELNTRGGKRILTTVRINVLYPNDDPIRLVWFERWLAQFKFEKRGHFEGGIKNGKE
jgi:L-amino acid N-acyltransferase YncA